MSQIHLVLMGPPGSGKGTQAARISERFRIPAISTGDILRASARQGMLPDTIRATMASGALVTDETIMALVHERLSRSDTERGYILDGFPRTGAQTEGLDQMLAGQTLLAIALIVPEVELERRLDSRRICLNCKAIYDSGTRHGSEEEHCSKCGVALIKRDDDNLATIKNRLQTYSRITEPILKHYADRDALARIDGTLTPDAIFQTIAERISRTFCV